MLRVVIAIAVLAAALFGYRWYAANEDEKARLLAANTAAVVSVHFSQASSLTVYEANGVLLASTTDINPIGIPSSQTTRVPFNLEYKVDLARVSRADYRWDERSKTMFVVIPDVTVAKPNIDYPQAEISQKGTWIGRGAAQRLQRRASIQLTAAAKREAGKSENMEAARRSAAEVVTRITSAPLEAAGMSDVRIVVRFPFDRKPDQRWDTSRSLAEVLGK